MQAISADGTTIGGQGLNLDTYLYVAWIAKTGVDSIFADGFESGDTTAWTITVQ